MTEQAGIEEEDYNVEINFEGHPPEHIELRHVALGVNPGLLLVVEPDDNGTFVFDIDAFGTEDVKGFLETVIAVLQTLLDKPLEFPEAGVPDASADGQAES